MDSVCHMAGLHHVCLTKSLNKSVKTSDYQHSHILLRTPLSDLYSGMVHLPLEWHVLIIHSLSFLSDKNRMPDTHSHLHNMELCINCRWKWPISHVLLHCYTFISHNNISPFLWNANFFFAVTATNYRHRQQPQTTATGNSHVQLYFPALFLKYWHGWKSFAWARCQWSHVHRLHVAVITYEPRVSSLATVSKSGRLALCSEDWTWNSKVNKVWASVVFAMVTAGGWIVADNLLDDRSYFF